MILQTDARDKELALKLLEERRGANKDNDWREFTASLPAGSPMYFGCTVCNAAIIVPEGYIFRSHLCFACSWMKEMGWLS